MDERVGAGTDAPQRTERARHLTLTETGRLYVDEAEALPHANDEGVWQTEAFHRLFYGNPNRTWLNTVYKGYEVQKCPLDLWIMQEILQRVKPDVLIETGTHRGGSAFFFADMGASHVFSIDTKAEGLTWPLHSRISYLHGSSTDPRIFKTLQDALTVYDTVMVDLDSDHHMAHVAKELELYAPLVTKGSYLIVEDTNLAGHPVQAFPGAGLEGDPGPAGAVEAFLETHDEFEVDRDAEKFYLTFNPRGYLCRIR